MTGIDDRWTTGRCWRVLTVLAAGIPLMLASSTTNAEPEFVDPPDNPLTRDATVASLIVRMPNGYRLSASMLAESSPLVNDTTDLAEDYQLIAFDAPVSLTTAERLGSELVDSGLVASAEPNRAGGSLGASPNDPGYAPGATRGDRADQWSLSGEREFSSFAGGAPFAPQVSMGGSQVDDAWDVTIGSPDTVVAVLDTGILPHPDIDDRLVDGRDLVSSGLNGSDPVEIDGDGRDDDETDPGPPASCPPGNSPGTWHGLRVAGVIGAETNNAQFLAGVDQRARIQPIRVFGCGAFITDIADGIRWAAGESLVGIPDNATPARVINLSLMVVGACGSYLQTAINAATNLGALVVAGAGNNGSAASGGLVDCDNVLVVGATTVYRTGAAYTSVGPGVDVSAPGGSLRSGTYERIDLIEVLSNASNTATPGAYNTTPDAGTSFAAPYVSGVASLMIARRPTLTPDQITTILTGTARPAGVPGGFATVADSFGGRVCSPSLCGAGIVDPLAAVQSAIAQTDTPPRAPRLTRATLAGSTANVSWQQPLNNGGQPVTGYTVTASPGGATCSTSGTTCNIGGLTGSATYTFSVAATNSLGAGPSSVMSNTVTTSSSSGGGGGGGGGPVLASVFDPGDVASASGYSKALTPFTPRRGFDTRSGLGGVPTTKLQPGQVLRVKMTGTPGVPATGVSALSMNLTAAQPEAGGFVSAWPCASPKPNASSLNFQTGVNIANAAVLAVDANGEICFESSAAVHLIADLNGWMRPSAGFEPRAPVRLFDTRLNVGGVGFEKLRPGQTLRFSLSGTQTSALLLNITATQGENVGFVTAWPCNEAMPDSSNLNFGAGRDAANGVILPVGANEICFTSAAPVHLIADFNGYFLPGAAFAPRTPRRIFDTRVGSGGVPTARVEPGRPVELPFVSGLAAVSMNVTVTQADETGFITVWPCNLPKPEASNVNYRRGANIANTVIVPVGSDGRVCFDTFSPVHLIADFNGFFPS